MNKLIVPFLMTVVFSCSSCRSWRMINDSNRNYYSGFCRSFDMTDWKFKEDKYSWYILDLYKDSVFMFSEICYGHPHKCGNGTRHDCGDYIILDFNRYDRNNKQRELQESLTGCSTIKMMCMVLKKKGRKDLKILPSNAVLSSIY